MLSLTSVANAAINKPYLLENGEIVQILDPLTTYVPATPASVVQWPQNGQFPGSCVSEAVNKCPISNVKVYNVTYNDCDRPWVMCRCDDATVSLNRMVTMFGKVPVKSRVFVRHLFGWPDNTPNVAAYAFGSDIGLVGNLFTSTGADEMFILLHEVGHVLDSALGGVSSSSQFATELAKDTCVPRPYSQESVAEDVGDLNAFIYLQKVNRNAYDAANLQWNFSCMNNQLNFIEQKFGQYNVLGGTCPTRVPDSPIVTVTKRSIRGREVEIVSEQGEDTTGWVRHVDGAGFYGTKYSA
ncbi:hypothetical protein DFH27DRAFT_479070 [Peziza echinospora]|nr:hypothetical protein DFH27DRAFT_479070 [Peziza echinospora]